VIHRSMNNSVDTLKK